MIEKQGTKNRFDVISKMTEIDDTIVSSLVLAKEAYDLCHLAYFKRTDRIILDRIKLMLEEVKSLSNILTNILEDIDPYSQNTVLTGKNIPSTDPLGYGCEPVVENEPVLNPLDLN